MKQRTKRLPLALYGSETWSLTLRERRGLSAIESRVLRVVKWQGIGDKYIMRSFIIYINCQTFLGLNKLGLLGLVGHVARIDATSVYGFG
jgi:hypothetical protein